jgi:hypothetical protein
MPLQSPQRTDNTKEKHHHIKGHNQAYPSVADHMSHAACLSVGCDAY